MGFLGHILSIIVLADFSFNGVKAAAAAAWNRFFTVIGLLLATAAKWIWCYLLSHLFRWDTFLSLTVGAESISALLEHTSPNELKAALYGLIMAAVSLVLYFAELAHKLCKRCKTPRDSGTGGPRQWGCDGFGLLCSLLTLMSAILNYHYLSRGKQQPILFAVLPLAFSLCFLLSRLFQRRADEGTPRSVCSVCQAQAQAQA